ncbi:T6SS immunity protein Tli4 family protein [Achromobacter spanius]
MRRLIPLLCLVAGLATGAVALIPSKEGPAVNEITGPMRTWALGRQLIELPADWGPPSSGYAKVYYGGGADHTSVEIDILGQDITLAQFDEALSERARRIRAVQSSETGKSMLLGAEELARGKWLFQFQESLGGTWSQTYELHLLVNGTHVKLAADSYEGSNAQVESRLLELAPQVVAVKQAEAAGPGISLGPVIIRGAHDHEMGIVSFMARGSNVKLQIYFSDSARNESPRLIERMVRDFNAFRVWDPDLLRKGHTTLAGNPAEEYLMRYDMKDHRGLLFVAENYRDSRSLASPSVNFRLTAGGVPRLHVDPEMTPDKLLNWLLPNFVPRGDPPLWQRKRPRPPVDSTLSKDQALAIWDHAMRSLRPRYGAVAPPRVEPRSAFRGPTPAQAEADRKALDAFIASKPGTEK